jgi:hypothetical protein
MPTLFRRVRPAVRPSAHRPPLGFDVLESRDCPSAWDVPLASWYQSGPLHAQPPGTEVGITNAAPQIVGFTATPLGGGVYCFTGQVVDEFPGGLTVVFAGVPTLDGVEVVTGADGTFTLTIQLQTDGTDAGDVSVSTVDNIGQPSNQPVVPVNPRG